MPYVPTPKTWAAGNLITAPQLRSDVSGAIQLLANPPLFVGEQTTSAQSIPNNAITAVTLDTEIQDSLRGHQQHANPAFYYGMFPGWYLCQGFVPINTAAAGTNQLSCGIQGVQNGGALTSFGGTRIPSTSAAGYCAYVAKLMHMVNVGTFAGASNDYIQLYAFQTNGAASAQPLLNGAQGFPYLTVRWICANSGTAGLPVPVNANWVFPPSVVTSAFMNTNVRDTINFLTYPPIFEAVRTTGGGALASVTPLSTTTGTAVGLDTVVIDNYSAWNAGTNTWKAPVAGSYFCYGVVSITTGANADCLAAGLTITSSNYNGGVAFTYWGGTGTSLVSATSAQAVRRRLRLNANDTIQLAANQHDTGAAAANYSTNVNEPRMIIVWENA